MSNQHPLSIVIPAYNAQQTIAKTITAAQHQSYQYPVEIIVVDDGSTDHTSTIIKSFDNVIYIRQDNAGPASARNNGLRHAAGELVFFTDADCVPAFDWIERAVKHFSETGVAVVAGSYGIVNDEHILARCIHKEIIFRHRTRMPQYPKSFGSYNFCVRKKVFNEVGGFDTTYRIASGEDNDLSYKILAAGHKIYFDKECIVLHHYPERIGAYLREQFRHGFWRVKMYLDHPHMSRGDDYTFWKDIIEPPLVIACVGGLLAVPFLQTYSIALLVFCALLVLQLGSSIYINRDIEHILFYSAATLSRAFVRTAGFVTGTCHFSVRKLFKKK